jgi:hypothetical protein
MKSIMFLFVNAYTDFDAETKYKFDMKLIDIQTDQPHIAIASLWIRKYFRSFIFRDTYKLKSLSNVLGITEIVGGTSIH